MQLCCYCPAKEPHSLKYLVGHEHECLFRGPKPWLRSHNTIHQPDVRWKLFLPFVCNQAQAKSEQILLHQNTANRNACCNFMGNKISFPNVQTVDKSYSLQISFLIPPDKIPYAESPLCRIYNYPNALESIKLYNVNCFNAPLSCF